MDILFANKENGVMQQEWFN